MRLGRSLVVLCWLAAASSARADLSGSFDGTLAAKGVAAPIAVAAAVSQVGRVANGTIALPADLAGLGGAYLVQGTGTA